MPSPVAALARLLFRLRSFTPPLLLLAVVLSCWRRHDLPGPGGPAVDRALDGLGVALAAAGSALRAAVAGYAPAGRSQTRRMGAEALLTTGPYAVMQHPLYLGNTLILVGLVCLVNDPLAWVLGPAAFLLSTALITAAEEALLAQRFGAAHAAWAARVPRWSLDPRRWRAVAGLPFDWRTAVRREVNPLVGWSLTALALLGWEWWARAELGPGRALALKLLAGALLLLLALNKAWKLARPRPGA